LLEKDWLVFNNEAYVDEEEQKTRDIDIFAIHDTETDQIGTKLPEMFVGTDLAVECKKSETHAWVFLTRKKATPPGFGSGQGLDFLEVFSGGRLSFLGSGLEQAELPKLHFDAAERIAHAGVPLKLKKLEKKDRDGRDDIFEARNQLMKYSSSTTKRWTGVISQDIGRRDVILMFLAIVFDGQLYEARKEDGEMTVRKSDYILLKSGRYSKTQDNFAEYLIDVVSKDGLSKYLTVLNTDIGLVRSYFAKNKSDLLRKANNALTGLRMKA